MHLTFDQIQDLFSLKARYEACCGQILNLFEGHYQRSVCLYLDGLALQAYSERRGVQLGQCDPVQLRQEVLAGLLAFSSRPVTADAILDELGKVGPVPPDLAQAIRRDIELLEPQLDCEYGFA